MSDVAHGTPPTVGSLIARVGLTGQLLGQIFLTPMAAFGLTYLLVFTAEGGDFRPASKWT